MLKKLLIGLLAVVAIVLSIAARQGSSFDVVRHIDIQATPARIFPLISDPQQWREWSPWASRASVATIDITGASAPVALAMTMTFVKPVPPTSQAGFTLVQQGPVTRVTWRMRGPLTFRTRLIISFIGMELLLGSDLEKGLANLKAAAEK